jgi:predicted MFS family arabinose efflux permease
VKPWRVAMAGMLSLAVAMGIGRFAFTPLLPMMLADGVTDLPTASWLASANYLGYLVGALLCTFQPLLWRKLGTLPPLNGPLLVRAGLSATVLLTLGMALHVPGAWPALRFAAGVASAVVFVYTSGWCLGQLARLQVPAMGALIYTGPGGGIVLSGLAASGIVALHGSAATGWLIFGVLAAALTAAIWPVFDPKQELPPPAAAVASAQNGASHGATEMALLTLAYGLAGFGYIITATFLPVIARQALPGSPWLDLFWPLFGLGVIAGALIASRLRTSIDLRLLLAGCYAIQALGVASSLVSPTLAGFAIGSLLLGLPFTAITFFAMQEVRRLKPAQASSYMGLVTAMYGLGQIVGPPLAAAMLARSRTAGEGFTLSLEIAAAALVLGVGLYVLMARAYPVKTT